MSTRNWNTDPRRSGTLGFSFVLGAALLAGAVAVGCKSASPKEQAQTEAKVASRAFSTDLSHMPPQIDRTVNAMEDVVRPGNPDVRGSLAVFDREFDVMSRNAKMVRQEADAASRDTEKYLGAWGGEAMAGDTGAREGVLSDREAASDRYETVRSMFDETAKDFRKLVTELEKHRARLGGNPTPEAIAAVREQLGEVSYRGTRVKQHIAAIMERMGSGTPG